MNDRTGYENQSSTLAEDRDSGGRVEARLTGAGRRAAVCTLAAGVAHELNNPLTWVVTNLEELAIGLRDDSIPREELRERVQETSKGVDRIRSIVDGLRTFTETDEDRRSLISVDSALNLALKVAEESLRGRVTVVRRFSETPDVLANEGSLSQVFLNLIMNALQAFSSGDANRIELATSRDGSDVVVEVRDNGPGIPREDISRLFDPFFTTRPVGAGPGLGLSVSLNILRALDGSIDIDTEVGQGTTFRIRLPQAPETLLRDTQQSRPVQVESRSSEGPGFLPKGPGPLPLPSQVSQADQEEPTERDRKSRVMLVDDEPGVLQALNRVLRRSFDVVVASSGTEAIGLLRSGIEVDAVVTDLRMPNGSGIELHGLLESEAPLLAERLLFLTGGGFSPDEFAYLHEPGRRWVAKPVRGAKLIALVREILAKAP
jgi:nitrogen-specific signal transduction histidine kinase